MSGNWRYYWREYCHYLHFFLFNQDTNGGSVNDYHITYSPSVPEPPPGGLTSWIEMYMDGSTTSHRFCVQQMAQFSGKRENVTMVITIHTVYARYDWTMCDKHKISHDSNRFKTFTLMPWWRHNYTKIRCFFSQVAKSLSRFLFICKKACLSRKSWKNYMMPN